MSPRWYWMPMDFLRHALFLEQVNPYAYCPPPVIIRDIQTPLGDVLSRLKVEPQTPGDDVIDRDIILTWGDERRVITGADMLGWLMSSIIIQSTEGKSAIAGRGQDRK